MYNYTSQRRQVDISMGAAIIVACSFILHQREAVTLQHTHTHVHALNHIHVHRISKFSCTIIRIIMYLHSNKLCTSSQIDMRWKSQTLSEVNYWKTLWIHLILHDADQWCFNDGSHDCILFLYCTPEGGSEVSTYTCMHYSTHTLKKSLKISCTRILLYTY